MNDEFMKKIHEFIELTGLDEIPMGIYFSDAEPASAFSPHISELPTREKEKANALNWQEIFGNFSCAIGHIWRARKKQGIACFSADKFGCPGCAFWMGFNKPQTETLIHYVSTGIPGRMEGEYYCDSPDSLRRIFEMVDPEPAPAKFCVLKPLDQFINPETPLFVALFARPEVLCGIHQLAAFVTHDPNVVVSPWSAACGSLIAWPMHYLARQQSKAVIGGWDPSARKFFRGDELSMTLPFSMFSSMMDRYQDSFLTRNTWSIVQKKIARSRKVWGE